MTTKSNSDTRVELPVVTARWLAYLVTAAGFALLGMLDPTRVTFSLNTPPILTLLGLALVYNLIVTVFALVDWLDATLRIATVVADLFLLAAGYYLLFPVPNISNLSVDPLYFVALLPIVTVSIRYHWAIGVMLGFLVGILRSGLLLWGLPEPFAADSLLLAVSGALVLVIVAFFSGYLGESSWLGGKKLGTAAQREAQKMRTSLRQAEALQQMSSTLGSTLSFERVIESALEAAVGAMDDWGARGELVGMVFLFQGGQRMRLAAACNLPRYESGQGIPGQRGIVARCLEEADIVVSQVPRNDPELASFTGISNCRVAAAVPMRAGFENYGAIVFATPALEAFDEDQLELFSALASQATIALHNALLYQDLQTEKDRIVAIEDEAKRKLSRDLHDGPTQSISAIAMRVNFLRKALLNDRERMAGELEMVEEMALRTVKEIRHMLFTLRPLVLETQGLVPALRTLVEQIQELVDINIQIREIGNATHHLGTNEASVVFYVVEEALGNARKYSEANLIEVRLWVEDNLFVAQVADDGVGFDAKEVMGNYESRGSLGMVNMRERAALINGSLDLKSAPEQGTTITLVVPLKKADSN